VLVLTGVSRRADLEATDTRPDYVFDHLPEVEEALRRGDGR
jgi:ribonucleotide monophosphatase NagD (HAD superfamily)